MESGALNRVVDLGPLMIGSVVIRFAREHPGFCHGHDLPEAIPCAKMSVRDKPAARGRCGRAGRHAGQQGRFFMFAGRG